MIDVGTGTGILSMVAAHEGARSVLAMDVDPDVPVEQSSALAPTSRQPRTEWPVRGVRLECASWKELESIDADVVVANINTTILERAVRSMFGTILLSGILVEQVDDLDFPDDSEVMEQRNAVECAPLVIKRARHG